eukprot:1082830-Pleurochrysis_carterae.AAC.1
MKGPPDKRCHWKTDERCHFLFSLSANPSFSSVYPTLSAPPPQLASPPVPYPPHLLPPCPQLPLFLITSDFSFSPPLPPASPPSVFLCSIRTLLLPVQHAGTRSVRSNTAAHTNLAGGNLKRETSIQRTRRLYEILAKLREKMACFAVELRRAFPMHFRPYA